MAVMVRKWAPQTQPGLDADVMLYRETRLRGGGQARGTAETTPSVSHAKRRRRVANSCKSVSECTQCVFSSSSSKYSAGLSRRHGVHNGTMQTSICAPESCPPYSTDSRLPELPSGSDTLTTMSQTNFVATLRCGLACRLFHLVQIDLIDMSKEPGCLFKYSLNYQDIGASPNAPEVQSAPWCDIGAAMVAAPT